MAHVHQMLATQGGCRSFGRHPTILKTPTPKPQSPRYTKALCPGLFNSAPQALPLQEGDVLSRRLLTGLQAARPCSSHVGIGFEGLASKV